MAMDITCTCGEPWDFYFMLNEVVHETDLDEQVIKSQWKQKLTPVFEKAFDQLGWRFVGHSLLAIAQCPACKDKLETAGSRERAEVRGALAELMGDDLDGLASELEDLGRMEGRATS
jgi:hypothetical protein